MLGDVIPRCTIPVQLTRLAATREGVVTREEINRFGVSDDVIRRLVREGQWWRIAPGIIAISPDSWLQRVWAGLLIGGDGAVIGMNAAARLWNLSWTQSRNRTAELPIEVFVPRSCRTPAAREHWRFIRADRVGQLSPQRTSIAQTIVDLSAAMTADEMAALVGQCVGQRRVMPTEVLEALRQTPRHPQQKVLTSIVSDCGAGVTSALEWHYVNEVERPHGLPRAQRQAKPAGLFTVDNLYRDQNVIVELDSYAYHRGAAAAQDLERDRIHDTNGYVTLRFTWRDVVDRPCQTAAEVAKNLTFFGWTGALTSCKRCRAKK
ncbi:MAG: DUF559 domain-containing protein [Propionibacteriaceae bacterium]|nr:DUF559 domain-containing protein [Propionibacteriaceae bacterium]